MNHAKNNKRDKSMSKKKHLKLGKANGEKKALSTKLKQEKEFLDLQENKTLKDENNCKIAKFKRLESNYNKRDYEDITDKELDMKINHNEQTYCYCKYISFGNMIKCDNDDVRLIYNTLF